MHDRTLTQGDVKSTLIRFTLPFLAATLLQFLYGAVDLIIVGQFCDPASITGVSVGSQLTHTITSGITGLATGGTVLVGQYIGARRDKDVSRTIGTMFTLFAIIAVVLTVVFTLGTNTIVALMQVPEEAVAPARQYLFICSCGIIFSTGYNMVSSILRGLGDSKRPMYFIAISCILNVIGDLILVGPCSLGAAGAAIATIAAQAVSLILSLVVLKRQSFPFDFKRSGFRLRREKASSLLRLGAPVAIQNVLVSLSFLIITAIINNMDVVAMSAATGVTERVLNFAFLAPAAFIASISAMVAQNMGARQPERAYSTMKYGMIFCLIIDVALFVLIQLFPGPIVGLFTPDAEVARHGILYLRTYGIDCLLVSFVFCLDGFFSGCGCTKFTMLNCLVATFAVRVPVVFIISLIPGITLFHIGIAAPVASVVQIIMQLIYLRTGRWNRSVLAPEGAP